MIVATNDIGIYTNNFIYDGWNLIGIFDQSNNLFEYKCCNGYNK